MQSKLGLVGQRIEGYSADLEDECNWYENQVLCPQSLLECVAWVLAVGSGILKLRLTVVRNLSGSKPWITRLSQGRESFGS